MSDIDHILYALADHWIKPGEMLNMDYAQRHIQHHVGRILADQSAKLWEQYSPHELALLQTGKRAKP
jgi:hypothetical protein